jgi:hypothetical protein
MAIPFLNNIDLRNNEVQNARLHNTGSANTNPGQIYFDTGDNLAKYYSNGTDIWVSLKEYSFSNGTFVNLNVTGTTAKPIITAELSATGTPNDTVYLRGDNTWAAISGISGTTYDLESAQAGSDVVILLNGSDSSQDVVRFLPGTNITLTDNGSNEITIDAANPDQTINLTGDVEGIGTTSIITTIKDGVLDVANFNASAIVTEAEGIENHDNDTTIPTSAAVKDYVDSAVVGGLIYQGGFDGSTGYVAGTTDYLDNRGTQIEVNKGWTYTVTVAGTFYGENVEVGDVLIAEDDLASGTGTLADWTTVQNNIDIASASQIGIGNVVAATVSALDGLDVTYSSGTATIGLDIYNLPTITSLSSDVYIPVQTSGAIKNRKATVSQIAEAVSTVNSYATTITGSNTIVHNLGTKDVIVQLYDVTTNETVYADVERSDVNEVDITFSTTLANDIRVLVQKIG